ncbi:MAG: co-chaperone GroES [Parcubacteria group bacterium CG10_big_fil_rev_8_21_14_0_10_36_14]|nr:MAG: co-chaperone GroES [Parcubacteria group bacterium CG10_big_fil_rev_8_21_14_0_10_36_14]
MLKPLNDRVLVKPLKNEEKTAGGIILPDTVEKERSEKGEVIAVGPGRMLETGQRASMSVAVGNKVLFKKYSPEEIKVDGEEYLVLDERDILAIIE